MSVRSLQRHKNSCTKSYQVHISPVTSMARRISPLQTNMVDVVVPRTVPLAGSVTGLSPLSHLSLVPGIAGLDGLGPAGGSQSKETPDRIGWMG